MCSCVLGAYDFLANCSLFLPYSSPWIFSFVQNSSDSMMSPHSWHFCVVVPVSGSSTGEPNVCLCGPCCRFRSHELVIVRRLKSIFKSVNNEDSRYRHCTGYRELACKFLFKFLILLFFLLRFPTFVFCVQALFSSPLFEGILFDLIEIKQCISRNSADTLYIRVTTWIFLPSPARTASYYSMSLSLDWVLTNVVITRYPLARLENDQISDLFVS